MLVTNQKNLCKRSCNLYLVYIDAQTLFSCDGVDTKQLEVAVDSRFKNTFSLLRYTQSPSLILKRTCYLLILI